MNDFSYSDEIAYASESLDSILSVSTEGLDSKSIKEFIRKLWEKIKSLFAKAIKRCKELWNKYIRRDVKVKDLPKEESGDTADKAFSKLSEWCKNNKAPYSMDNAIKILDKIIEIISELDKNKDKLSELAKNITSMDSLSESNIKEIVNNFSSKVNEFSNTITEKIKKEMSYEEAGFKFSSNEELLRYAKQVISKNIKLKEFDIEKCINDAYVTIKEKFKEADEKAKNTTFYEDNKKRGTKNPEMHYADFLKGISELYSSLVKDMFKIASILAEAMAVLTNPIDAYNNIIDGISNGSGEESFSLSYTMFNNIPYVTNASTNRFTFSQVKVDTIANKEISFREKYRSYLNEIKELEDDLEENTDKEDIIASMSSNIKRYGINSQMATLVKHFVDVSAVHNLLANSDTLGDGKNIALAKSVASMLDKIKAYRTDDIDTTLLNLENAVYRLSAFISSNVKYLSNRATIIYRVHHKPSYSYENVTNTISNLATLESKLRSVLRNSNSRKSKKANLLKFRDSIVAAMTKVNNFSSNEFF